MTFGISNNLEFSALNKGDTPAPQRPDLAFSDGHIGTSRIYTWRRVVFILHTGSLWV